MLRGSAVCVEGSRMYIQEECVEMCLGEIWDVVVEESV